MKHQIPESEAELKVSTRDKDIEKKVFRGEESSNSL